MTTSTSAVAAPHLRPRLIFAELRKARTTHLWWILTLCGLVAIGLALLLNGAIAYYDLDSQLNPPPFVDEEGVEHPQPPQDAGPALRRHAANLFTSGQYFGLLIMMLFGALMITNEYYHQTATSTFLVTPQRSKVVFAKLATAISVAAGAWFVTTVINVVAGTTFFSMAGYTNSLGVWSVQRSIILNLLAYVVWAVLGIGLGALLRNQLAATLVGAGAYLIGDQLVALAFILLYQFVVKEAWVLQLIALAPASASQIMISPERLQLGDENGVPIYGPHWWVGLIILIGYALLFGGIGTLLLRRRDIS